MLPEQKRGSRRRRHIPSEIVEDILVNLSVKSLVRFSYVSKSWNSMINFDPKFIRRQSKIAASRELERIRIVSEGSLEYGDACVSSMDFATPPTPLLFPRLPYAGYSEVDAYGYSEVHLLASCGDLWCVAYTHSLFLWNPSTRSFKKLPHPSIPHEWNKFFYGLGYDSVGDDYKIVQIHRWPLLPQSKDIDTEVYSLRSDSWRKSNPFNGRNGPHSPGVACNGALHWVMMLHSEEVDVDVRAPAIITFIDLSTEKYGEVAMPLVLPYDFYPELAVLREKLCMYINYNDAFILWEMQEYGVAESWTKKFVIDCCNLVDCVYTNMNVEPLYLYGNGKLLIKAVYQASHDDDDDDDDEYQYGHATMFINIEKKTKPQTVFSHYGSYTIGHLYMESLVSPATYCTLPTTSPSP